MAHSTPLHCGNSSMARSAPTPPGTPSTSGNRDIHRPVLQARGTAYSTPQMLRATSQVDKFRLKVEEYDKIVQYLEIPENFALLHGAGKKTRVGGRCQSKSTFFKQMLGALQQHGAPFTLMTTPNLQKRYQRYEAKYKEARNLSTSTGAGLTEEELDLGISLEDKLNKVCPHFDRMHLLLGGRPNVNPRGTAVLGIDDDEFITHDDSDDEEDPTVPAYSTTSPPLPTTPTVILTGNTFNL
ncbi:unnamed protein product [Calypogeia fissa]